MGLAAYHLNVSNLPVVLIFRRLPEALGRKRKGPHINKLLEVLIEIGQVVSPFFVIRNQLLLTLQKFLSLLLQRLPFSPLVIYARDHQCVLVVVNMLGVLGEEFFRGDQR